MENKFLTSKPVEGMLDVTYTMWSMGWDEANGGNVSYILDEEELKLLDEDNKDIIELVNIPENMVGKYLLITASGSQFRTLKNTPLEDLGVIKIHKDGYEIVWGFETGKRPTSELYMHLLSHSTRLKVNPEHRVVCHNHASNAIAYSHLVEPNDKDYTLPLWKILTESVVVFPDGVGVLPWELPGTEIIGIHTAEKLELCRIVVWAYHGILATGSSYQDCFGLLETVDKAAAMYIQTLPYRISNALTQENIKGVCKALNVNPRDGILD